jgi:16S rRNA (cytidine1402-2'-O)-methyltransferase
MGNLYVIATPIGNREDITIRALNLLFEVDVLLCEDTRKTKQLLLYFAQEYSNILKQTRIPRLVSYFEHNEIERIPEVIDLLRQDFNVGLVSNSGTPLISDPGFKLVKTCREQGFKVLGVPGANALITAISISGYSSDKFLFLGFLPRKHGKQVTLWEDIKESKISKTVVFYESPFRLKKTLEGIKEVFGDIEISVARELTKMHEEFIGTPISDWSEKLKKQIKGELVVMFRYEVE